MLERNDELIEKFNKEEQMRQRMERCKRARRKWVPKLSRRLHKILDHFGEEIERQVPVDCISKKWIE